MYSLDVKVTVGEPELMSKMATSVLPQFMVPPIAPPPEEEDQWLPSSKDEDPPPIQYRMAAEEFRLRIRITEPKRRSLGFMGSWCWLIKSA